MTTETAATAEVLFDVAGGVGRIVLNRPKAMNALTLGMIRAMDAKLRAWAADPAVRAVVVEGAGDRAFCAGGDIRALFDARNTPGSTYHRDFYGEEYILNRLIYRFPKPYIALVDGVVMGGGVGVSVHGSHRIATERYLFAMPETGIGLFPDVGGSHFLPRCPGEIGMYLALTGARLKAADAIGAGIATDYVAVERLDELDAAWNAADWSGGDARAVADGIVARFAEDPGPAPLAEHRAAIDRCFAGDSVEEIVELLAAEGTEWAKKTGTILATKSPISLKIAYRQLRAGAGCEFEAGLVTEYRMARRCMTGHDFFEGVRAVVIDKDQTPHWRPDRLADVSAADIEAYFTAPVDGDLEFPPD